MNSTHFSSFIALILALMLGIVTFEVKATTSVTLPSWVCAQPDAIFVSGFENGEIAIPHDPSLGSGGAGSGDRSRVVHVPGLGSGTQIYYLHVPAHYSANSPRPLLFVLHGYAGDPTNANTYAQETRSDWDDVSDNADVIVIAPVASGSDGSWVVPPSDSSTDYDQFAAILADMELAYNVERTRLYLWGFSAGGHVAHDLALNNYSNALNANTLAAYAVSAGDLAGLACEGLTDMQCNQVLAAVPRKIPVDIHIGNSDPNLTYAQSDHQRFLNQGWIDGTTIFYTEFIGGHTYTIPQLSDIWNNLCPNALSP